MKRAALFATLLTALVLAAEGHGAAPACLYQIGTTTVLDNETGLRWQRTVNPTQMLSGDAATYCANLSLGGYTGWRIPTVKELATLVDNSLSEPSIDTTAFPSTPLGRYWTSTRSQLFPNATQIIDFSWGQISAAGTEILYVRCVR